jgi:hypothetical protein
MILDELFGQPIAKIKTIVKENGKLKVKWKPAPVSQSTLVPKVFFPISKERK